MRWDAESALPISVHFFNRFWSYRVNTLPDRCSLTLVMPVYNGQDTIQRVVKAWSAELERLRIDYEFRVYDDGSKDQTPAMLDQLAQEHPRLIVTHQANSGHGPTILRGYHQALGTWVFQTDSDDELKPDGFQALWEKRDSFDFLVSRRHHRQSSPARRLLTLGSQWAVRCLFARGVIDVNSPYRLMRRSLLQQAIENVPGDTFAPNVILSGIAGRQRWRIHNDQVDHQGARTVSGSLMRWKLWKTAMRAFMQTLQAAMRS